MRPYSERDLKQEEYVRAHSTKWDWIKTNLFFVPVFVFVFGLIRGFIIVIITKQDFELSLPFALSCIISYFILARLNHLGAKKIQRLKDEYKKLTSSD